MEKLISQAILMLMMAFGLQAQTAPDAAGLTRLRSVFPGSPSGDAEPFTAFYTLTFVNREGVWKAMAMHSSRP